jgi:hypothetical protein
LSSTPRIGRSDQVPPGQPGHYPIWNNPGPTPQLPKSDDRQNPAPPTGSSRSRPASGPVASTHPTDPPGTLNRGNRKGGRPYYVRPPGTLKPWNLEDGSVASLRSNGHFRANKQKPYDRPPPKPLSDPSSSTSWDMKNNPDSTFGQIEQVQGHDNLGPGPSSHPIVATWNLNDGSTHTGEAPYHPDKPSTH